MFTCLGWIILWPFALMFKLISMMNPLNWFYKKRPPRRDYWFWF